jgi:hypothetical protein
VTPSPAECPETPAGFPVHEEGLEPPHLAVPELNPVGVYRNAARCSQSGVSEGGSLPLASFRYAPWTIQGRFDPLQACCPPT